MSSNDNKPHKTGAKLIVISIICFVVSLFFPSGVEYGPMLLMLSLILCLVGIVTAILDIRYNRRLKKQNETNSIATAISPAEPIKFQRKTHIEELKVAGTSFHQSEIESIGEPNDDYSLSKKQLVEDFEGERVYQLSFYPDFKLVPEPNNEYDSLAIRIEADDALIGYVPKGKTKYIHELLDNNRIEYVGGEIKGGKYKIAYEDEDLEKGETNYYVTLRLHIIDPEDF